MFFKKPLKSTPPVPAADDKFTNQKDMLDALNRADESGMCSSLSNIVAKNYIKKGSTQLYTHSNWFVYLKASTVEDVQQSLGEKGQHSAFITTNTPYIVEEIPVERLSSQLKVEELGEHNLITFPVADTNSYHQIYVNKQGTQCVKFDPSLNKNTDPVNCLRLFDEFKKSIPKSNDPEKVVIVATTVPPL